jgi:Lipocalin-like domain
MNRIQGSLLALLCAGITMHSGSVAAQTQQNLVGTWSVVSVDNVSPDGRRVQAFGSNPKGQLILDANGRFSLQLIRPDLPKYSKNNRNEGTPEEYKATVQGLISYFGTYSLSGKDLVFHVDASSFPNWNGTEQKRTITVSGDELKWHNPAASTGGTAELVWKRAK